MKIMDLVFLVLKSFFAFTLILSVVVFVHEYGHYIVAKKCGVKIESFSIGFGREIFGWYDSSGTRWKFAMLPFGGYVQMFGDEDPSSSSKDKEKLEKLSESEKAQTLYYQNVYKRFAIVLAGPFFNLMFAILILTASYKINGITYLDPVISEIIQNSPAERAGIEEGDLITEINGKEVKTFGDVKSIIALNLHKNLEIGIIRGDKFFTVNITPELQEITDPLGNKVQSEMIGISSSLAHYNDANYVEAFIEANSTIYKICKNTLRALGQMIIGDRSLSELGGPIKIAKYSGQSLSKGFGTVIWFMVMISANLGLMNLLPIPMLDGGHLFLYIIEIVRRKPISDKIQGRLFKVGFAFLIGLMIFATVNDIISIF